MDGHVQEESTRNAQELLGRQFRVAVGNLEHARSSQFARLDDLFHLLETLVKPAIETHLQFNPRQVHGFKRFINFCQVQRDGFLAKDVFSGVCAIFDYFSMGAGGGGDQHSFDGFVRK